MVLVFIFILTWLLIGFTWNHFDKKRTLANDDQDCYYE